MPLEVATLVIMLAYIMWSISAGLRVCRPVVIRARNCANPYSLTMSRRPEHVLLKSPDIMTCFQLNLYYFKRTA